MTEPSLPDACPIAPGLVLLEKRVGALEGDMATVKDDTAVIRAAIVGVSHFGTFVKRHGRTMAGFAAGSMMVSGFFSEATIDRVKSGMTLMFAGHP